MKVVVVLPGRFRNTGKTSLVTVVCVSAKRFRLAPEANSGGPMNDNPHMEQDSNWVCGCCTFRAMASNVSLVFWWAHTCPATGI